VIWPIAALTSFGYLQLDPKEPSPDLSRPYWSCSLNYHVDEPKQSWQMLPPRGLKLPLMQATGTPAEIAKQICTIIKGNGGSLR
jgi:hypothetical protein